MNKKITFLTITAIMAMFMSVTSCKKSSNNTDQLATIGKATITGNVMAQLVDTFGTPGMQNAPSGTTIAAWIDTRDLVVNADGAATYGKRYYSATVDANGNYTLTVDVSRYQPVMVHIMPAQFTYNQVINGTTGTTTHRVIYNGVSADISVINGGTSYVDLMYN